jgi:hypothetical protein
LYKPPVKICFSKSSLFHIYYFIFIFLSLTIFFMKKLTLLLVFALLGASCLVAQTKTPKKKAESEKKVEKAPKVDRKTHKNFEYFDDGGLTGSLNVIKFGLITPIAGIPTVYYERSFGGSFSLEAGIGFMLPYAHGDGLALINQIFTNQKNNFEIDGVTSGFSWELQPKLWAKSKKDKVEGGYGLLYRNRTYTIGTTRVINYTDICGMYAYRYSFLPSHIVAELNFGVGVRLKTDSDTSGTYSSSNATPNIALPGNIKIGYIF